MNQPHGHEKHHHEPFHPDKSKVNYLQRCYYVINLLKEKDHELWENFHGQYCATKPEESWELFQMVVEEYRKLCDPPKVKRLPKKAAAKKPVAKKIPHKKPARKAA
jgi:glycerol-3-phosphate cytidylyltransferase-like family protein